jgi:hypothetical protein
MTASQQAVLGAARNIDAELAKRLLSDRQIVEQDKDSLLALANAACAPFLGATGDQPGRGPA